MTQRQLSGLLAVICSIFAVTALSAQQNAKNLAPGPRPRYENGKLLRPEGYREWVYLSSGLGMSYTAGPNGSPLFTNTFVPQWAYRQFTSSGKWPEKTMFVLEERSSETNGSINKAGRFQTDLKGLAVEVKDGAQFSDHWAYFNFGGDSNVAGPNPKESCWQCHDTNAAVEHSFVQFYPTLKPIAQQFGTYRSEPESDTQHHN